MARVTVEECLKFVENRFELVLVAAKRAHQLSSGDYRSTLEVGKDKPTVVALREIEAGLIDTSILSESFDMSKESQDLIQMDEVKAALSATAIDEADKISK